MLPVGDSASLLASLRQGARQHRRRFRKRADQLRHRPLQGAKQFRARLPESGQRGYTVELGERAEQAISLLFKLGYDAKIIPVRLEPEFIG